MKAIYRLIAAAAAFALVSAAHRPAPADGLSLTDNDLQSYTKKHGASAPEEGEKDTRMKGSFAQSKPSEGKKRPPAGDMPSGESLIRMRNEIQGGGVAHVTKYGGDSAQHRKAMAEEKAQIQRRRELTKRRSEIAGELKELHEQMGKVQMHPDLPVYQDMDEAKKQKSIEREKKRFEKMKARYDALRKEVHEIEIELGIAPRPRAK